MFVYLSRGYSQANPIHLILFFSFKLFQWDISTKFSAYFVLDLKLWYHFWVVCVLFVQFSVCQCRMIGINQLNVFCVCRWVHSVDFRFRFAFGDETFIGKSSQTNRTYHIWMANYSLGTRRHFYACIHSKLCGRQYMYFEPLNVHGILSLFRCNS